MWTACDKDGAMTVNRVLWSRAPIGRRSPVRVNPHVKRTSYILLEMISLRAFDVNMLRISPLYSL
jgi:hypothetical protein